MTPSPRATPASGKKSKKKKGYVLDPNKKRDKDESWLEEWNSSDEGENDVPASPASAAFDLLLPDDSDNVSPLHGHESVTWPALQQILSPPLVGENPAEKKKLKKKKGKMGIEAIPEEGSCYMDDIPEEKDPKKSRKSSRSRSTSKSRRPKSEMHIRSSEKENRRKPTSDRHLGSSSHSTSRHKKPSSTSSLMRSSRHKASPKKHRSETGVKSPSGRSSRASHTRKPKSESSLGLDNSPPPPPDLDDDIELVPKRPSSTGKIKTSSKSSARSPKRGRKADHDKSSHKSTKGGDKSEERFDVGDSSHHSVDLAPAKPSSTTLRRKASRDPSKPSSSSKLRTSSRERTRRERERSRSTERRKPREGSSEKPNSSSEAKAARRARSKSTDRPSGRSSSKDGLRQRVAKIDEQEHPIQRSPIAARRRLKSRSHERVAKPSDEEHVSPGSKSSQKSRRSRSRSSDKVGDKSSTGAPTRRGRRADVEAASVAKSEASNPMEVQQPSEPINVVPSASGETTISIQLSSAKEEGNAKIGRLEIGNSNHGDAKGLDTLGIGNASSDDRGAGGESVTIGTSDTSKKPTSFRGGMRGLLEKTSSISNMAAKAVTYAKAGKNEKKGLLTSYADDLVDEDMEDDTSREPQKKERKLSPVKEHKGGVKEEKRFAEIVVGGKAPEKPKSGARRLLEKTSSVTNLIGKGGKSDKEQSKKPIDVKNAAAVAAFKPSFENAFPSSIDEELVLSAAQLSFGSLNETTDDGQKVSPAPEAAKPKSSKWSALKHSKAFISESKKKVTIKKEGSTAAESQEKPKKASKWGKLKQKMDKSKKKTDNDDDTPPTTGDESRGDHVAPKMAKSMRILSTADDSEGPPEKPMSMSSIGKKKSKKPKDGEEKKAKKGTKKWAVLQNGMTFINKTKESVDDGKKKKKKKKDSGSQATEPTDIIEESQKHIEVFKKKSSSKAL